MTGGAKPSSTPRPSAGGGTASAGGRPHDERTEFLLQSLRDLEAEHAAGDIDDDDFAALRDDYTARAAAALRAEERGRAPEVVGPPTRSWGQRVAVVAGLVAFALVAGALVANAVGDRREGDGITGEITQTPTQAASECIDLTVSQELVDAIPCYQDVLAEDPDNAVAHTYLGWTLFLTARQAGDALPQDVLVDLYVRARDQLDQAVAADPGYADARAFQIVLAVREGRFDEAQAQLDAFDDLDAPADIQRLVDGIRQEVADGLAGGGGATDGTEPGVTSTTAPTSTAGP